MKEFLADRLRLYRKFDPESGDTPGGADGCPSPTVDARIVDEVVLPI